MLQSRRHSTPSPRHAEPSSQSAVPSAVLPSGEQGAYGGFASGTSGTQILAPENTEPVPNAEGLHF